jgi:hypothetical protein
VTLDDLLELMNQAAIYISKIRQLLAQVLGHRIFLLNNVAQVEKVMCHLATTGIQRPLSTPKIDGDDITATSSYQAVLILILISDEI